MDITLRAT